MVCSNSLKPKLLIICGPTACGKSDIAIELAKKFNGEIISADSMQIYKGMDIGTGKITKVEMAQVKHYMIDEISPDEEFSVSDFVQKTKRYIDEISRKGKLPIIAGGTGLYINMLLGGANLANAAKNQSYRDMLEFSAALFSPLFLHHLLKIADEISAQKISANDLKRTIRALEILYLTKKPKSQAAVKQSESSYDYKIICLEMERQTLYQRINDRVKKMFKNGLVDEVKRLEKFKSCNSMQAIGYKEVLYGLENNQNIEQIIETVSQKSRNYAKRQITYFKNMPFKAEFINPADKNKIFCETEKFISL